MKEIVNKRIIKNSSTTFKIKVKDEDGSLTIPKSFNYTVKDLNGDIVNNIDNKAIVDLDSTVYVTLNNEDLPTKGWYKLYITCVFDGQYANNQTSNETIKYYVYGE